MMEVIFLKELMPYSKENLVTVLQLSDHKFDRFINALKSKNIVKAEKDYKFNFVGLLQFEDKTIFFIPKYVQREEDYSEVMKQLLQLFHVYSKREKITNDEIESLGSFQHYGHYNLISIIDFLLRDYREYGLYSNEKDAYEWNRNGEINWNRTIEEGTAYILKGSSIYFDYVTNVILNDEEDVIRKIHKYVLSQCTKFLERTGLIGYFTFPSMSFEIELDDLGSIEFILSKIKDELTTQFSDRKQLVLKALYSFISKSGFKGQQDGLVIYGTRSFYHIWEKVCTYLLGDETNKTFREMIDKPIWTDAFGTPSEKDTLEPDILRETTIFGYRTFLILDAKYYKIYFKNGEVKNNPGVEDVTKQYMYELAYKDYFKKHKITHIYNLFLFPHDQLGIIKLGKVSISFLRALQLQDVTLIVLPASELFDYYLKSKKYTSTDFERLITVVKS